MFEDDAVSCGEVVVGAVVRFPQVEICLMLLSACLFCGLGFFCRGTGRVWLTVGAAEVVGWLMSLKALKCGRMTVGPVVVGGRDCLP